MADGEWGIDGLGLRLMEAHTPIVEAALKTLNGRISASLFEQSKTLSEMRQILEMTEPYPPTGVILNAIMRAQHEFEQRATASSARVDASLNVARRTELLYEQFRENVRNIAPRWLSDDFKPKVKESILEHGSGDVREQVVNAEYTVFRTAFSGKASLDGMLVYFCVSRGQGYPSVVRALRTQKLNPRVHGFDATLLVRKT